MHYHIVKSINVAAQEEQQWADDFIPVLYMIIKVKATDQLGRYIYICAVFSKTANVPFSCVHSRTLANIR